MDSKYFLEGIFFLLVNCKIKIFSRETTHLFGESASKTQVVQYVYHVSLVFIWVLKIVLLELILVLKVITENFGRSDFIKEPSSVFILELIMSLQEQLQDTRERGMAHCLRAVIKDVTFWEPYCRQSLAYVKSCLCLIRNEPDGISSKTGRCSCCQN